MHVNCADFVYKAMGELIQVLYLYALGAFQITWYLQQGPKGDVKCLIKIRITKGRSIFSSLCVVKTKQLTVSLTVQLPFTTTLC